MARGLSLNGLNISSKLEELEEERVQAKKWALELEKALEVARSDLKKARDETGIARDEVEDVKLELIQSKKKFEEELVKARA